MTSTSIITLLFMAVFFAIMIWIGLSIYTHLTKYKEEQAIQMFDKHLKERKNEPEKRLLRVL